LAAIKYGAEEFKPTGVESWRRREAENEVDEGGATTDQGVGRGSTKHSRQLSHYEERLSSNDVR